MERYGGWEKTEASLNWEFGAKIGRFKREINSQRHWKIGQSCPKQRNPDLKQLYGLLGAKLLLVLGWVISKQPPTKLGSSKNIQSYCWWKKSQTITVWMVLKPVAKKGDFNYLSLNWWVDPRFLVAINSYLEVPAGSGSASSQQGSGQGGQGSVFLDRCLQLNIARISSREIQENTVK